MLLEPRQGRRVRVHGYTLEHGENLNEEPLLHCTLLLAVGLEETETQENPNPPPNKAPTQRAQVPK